MIIEVENLSVAFGKSVVLDRVSFSLAQGVVGLLGHNGAGKTTLLRALLGLVKRTQGSVRIRGLDPQRNGPDVRRSVGFVPDVSDMLGNLSAFEFLRMACELHGMRASEARERAHLWIRWTQLEAERDQLLQSLPFGVKQRLVLAQALVGRPSVLLVDEPTSGLDREHRENMLSLIAEHVRQTGATVLFSTHILEDLIRLCDSMVVLESGRLVHQGDVASYVHPLVGRKRIEGIGDLGALRLRLEEAQVVVSKTLPRGLELRLGENGNAQIVFACAASCDYVITGIYDVVPDLHSIYELGEGV